MSGIPTDLENWPKIVAYTGYIEVGGDDTVVVEWNISNGTWVVKRAEEEE